MCISIQNTSGERVHTGAVLLVYNRPVQGDPLGSYEMKEEGYPTPEMALAAIDALPNLKSCWGRIETLQGTCLYEFEREEF